MQISESQKLFAALRVPRALFGFWLLSLFGALLTLGCSPQAVMYPQQGMTIWQDHDGGTIAGMATLRYRNSDYIRTCAGYDAFIMPVTRTSTAFMQQNFVKAPDLYAPSMQLVGQLGPFITANGGGRVPCRDDGTFTFDHLANGQYYVLADIKWLLRWAHEGGTLAVLAEVKSGQSSYAKMDVLLDRP